MGIEWANGEQTHEEAVLAYPVYHHVAGAVDLDHVFARVFEAGTVSDVETGPGGENRPALAVIVDATDELRELVQLQMEQRARLLTEIEEVVTAFKHLVGIRAGDCVEVHKGRKVKRGTCGTVRRTVEGEWGLRAQLSTGQWTAVSNLRPFREAQEVEEVLRRAAALNIDLAEHCAGPVDEVMKIYEEAA